MGSPLRKLTKLANKTMPHTWIMGERASAGVDLAGQLTGAHDALYKPAAIAPAPALNTDAAYLQRDRVRRMAQRAQGQASTIRTSSTGAPYTGAPKQLLGS